MLDFSPVLDLIQQGLGRAYRDNFQLANIPGRSLLLRIDYFYFIAPYDAFLRQAGRWAAIIPERAREVLVRSGNIITSQGNRLGKLNLDLALPGNKRAGMEVCLLHSTFVDQALGIYGGRLEPLPVSAIRLARWERPVMERFLLGKTPLSDAAFEK